MNKIISTSDRLFMAVCGPSGCGKTEIIFQKLLKNTFFPNFKSIYYFYQHDQPKFQTMERNLNIYFTKFSGFEFISQLENCLLVFDDSCEEIFNDKEFSKLGTAGRHKKSVLSMLSIICFNRVNGLEQLISTQHTSFCSNLPEIYSR